jgi:hypothetical protein
MFSNVQAIAVGCKSGPASARSAEFDLSGSVSGGNPANPLWLTASTGYSVGILELDSPTFWASDPGAPPFCSWTSITLTQPGESGSVTVPIQFQG